MSRSPRPERGGSPPVRLLLVEDSLEDAERVRLALSKASPPELELSRESSLTKAKARLEAGPVDAALVSLSLPDASGLRLLRELVAACPGLPIIALADEAHRGLELSLLRAGAQEIVQKNELSVANLPRLLHAAIARRDASDDRAASPGSVETRVAQGVVREFGDLLVAILGNIELAQRSLPDGSRARHSLDESERAAQTAIHLTRQLACYAGRAKLRLQPISLARLLARPQELVGAPDLAGVQIRSELRHRASLVSVDVALMRDVVRELLANAVEANIVDANAIEIGAETPIEIALHSGRLEADRSSVSAFTLESPLPEGELVWFEVRDTGSGIEKPALTGIFEPFRTTRFSRTGLGLAAAAGVVRRHGGAIGVASEPGVLTRVRIFLPRAPAAHASATDRTGIPTAAPGRRAGQSGAIPVRRAARS